jgi:hypothetical protein
MGNILIYHILQKRGRKEIEPNGMHKTLMLFDGQQKWDEKNQEAN